MTARDEHLADALCHCEVDPDGHPLGTPGCASVVKVGNRHPVALCQRDHGAQVSTCPCQGPARGTCPGCGKRGKVVALRLGRGIYASARPAMAPHRTGGRECPGTGQVPAETTYTPPTWAARESEAS